METEIWKPIPNTIGYFASTLGRIKGPNKILNPATNGKAGYRQCRVRMTNGTRVSKTVHSLVALTFIGPRPKGLDIAHRDNNKANNRPDNLRYCTRLDNLKDSAAARIGMNMLQPTRAEPIFSNRIKKITLSQRREIVDRVMSRQETNANIANDYGLTPSSVSKIYRAAMVA